MCGGPVREVLAEAACWITCAPHRHLVAADGVPAARLLPRGDGRVAGVADRLKDKLLALARLAPTTRSRYVVIIWPLVNAAPDVDEDEVVFADRRDFSAVGS